MCVIEYEKQTRMIGAPMPPTGDSAPRSSATYQRRKFVSKGKSGVGSRLKHVKLATVQQALEDDSTAVESLKRDVANFQTLELETSRRYLVSLQKTYDKLKSEADVRELQQKVHHEELVTLDRLCTEARKNLTHPNAGIAQMQDEIAQEETAVRVAQEQKDVFQHMIKRLSDDMLAVRQTGFGIKDQLNTARHTASTLSSARARAGFVVSFFFFESRTSAPIFLTPSTRKTRARVFPKKYLFGGVGSQRVSSSHSKKYALRFLAARVDF